MVLLEVSSVLGTLCLVSVSSVVVTAQLLYICSRLEPGSTEAPPTSETSLQHVALFINRGVAKSAAGGSRGGRKCLSTPFKQPNKQTSRQLN